MIAVVTSAHFSFFSWLRARHNRAVADIYKHRRLRRAQYLDCIQKLLAYQRHFSQLYLLECSGQRVPRYLRKEQGLIYATAENRADSPNKGVKEFVNIANFLRTTGIPSHERVFKLTGRYLLLSDAFLEYSSRSAGDVVAKRDDDLWGTSGKGVHTFMFSCRAGIITSFADWLLEGDRRIGIGTTPIEWIFLEYLTAEGIAVDFYNEKMFLQVNYAPPAKAMFV